MKKVLFSIVFVMTFIFRGCLITDDGGSNQIAQDLVQAFDNKDIMSAKEFFAKEAEKKDGLTKQLKQAFKFYNSKSISMESSEVLASKQRDDTDYDEETVEAIVKTKETSYVFMVTMYTYHSDPDHIGVTQLTITKENDPGNQAFVGMLDEED